MANMNREQIMELVGSKPDGQRVKNFCAEKGITEAVYYYWRCRLMKRNDKDTASSGFLPVRIKESGSGNRILASIDLPGKAVIHIYDAGVIPLLRHIL